ncbi:hypothetical protein N8T08_001452 [Aspergillus melleus]|uniref:Uncharacterized protein n=1 Tax=Aspergillus melleus TaxID=138277 RepID=A0ACC3BAE4_9EURO|nr:hypothetical protein N8T08_001452 [Aspergillus melleus]
MSQYYDKMPQQAEASYPFQHVQPPGYVHQQQDYVPPQHYSHNQHGSPSLNAGQCHCLNCSADGQDRSGSPYPPVGESASYYDGSSFSQQQSHGQEGEKGLGSTVIGGAAGGYVAHQMGGGKLAIAGGAVLGAVGMNMVNHKL